MTGKPEKFYRTTMTVIVLSKTKDPQLYMDMDAAVGSARVVCDIADHNTEEIDGPAMAKALNDARSYPGFFDLEEEWDEG